MAENSRRNRDPAVIALAGGATHRDAAKAAGVHERSIRRWLDDPAFREAIDQARGQILETALGRLSDLCTRATEVFRELMDDADTPASVRLGAARAVFEHTVRVGEFVDVRQAVNEIKAALESLEAA